MEKSLYINAALFFLIIAYQIVVHIHYLKLNIDDFRVLILFMALASTLNLFLHYTVMTDVLRYMSYPILQMFEYLLMFMVCYYYTYKSTGILRNRKTIMWWLRFFFGLSIVYAFYSCTFHFFEIKQYVAPDGSGFTDIPTILGVQL